MLDAIGREYEKWLNRVEERHRAKLLRMPSDAVEDAFFCELKFGTGGLRGKLGIGPNRMNSYTVGKATQGLADYLNTNFAQPTVALCRDTRHGSEEFVRKVAEVLAGNNISAYIYKRVEPTPALSFAVRELGCSAGVNITASHNPAAYNGYKVYGSDGCQITVRAADAIQSAIDRVDCFDGVKAVPFDEAIERGLVSWMSEDVIDSYVEEVLASSTHEDCSSLSVVYTPLHGVGFECVSRVLDAIGVARVVRVDEQCVLDGDFPTCPYPNPEIRDALEVGLEYCNRVQPDLLLATDPDADRVGIAVFHEGEYKLLSGNEVGLLLLDFLARKNSIAGVELSRKVACTTIVSAPMADDLAREWGFELRRTLTGFKYIGEQVGLLESEGRKDDFLMGFEESYGYLMGTSVRDKDAVAASMLICEMTAYWKARELDLYEAMEALYEHYGFWACGLLSQSYEGLEGALGLKAMMAGLRDGISTVFGEIAVVSATDYASGVSMPVVNSANGVGALPSADVFELRLSDGSRVIFRPSGTEPKAKAYVFARGTDRGDAKEKLEILSSAAKNILEGNR